MNRSRTFTRELNDPKAEDDLIIEELEPKIVPKKHVKRFKLNTTQIEVNTFYPPLLKACSEYLAIYNTHFLHLCYTILEYCFS